MINIGCHLSFSKGFTAMADACEKIGANTFQYFTRNPRGGAAKEIDPKDAARYKEIALQKNFMPIVAHAPYTLNLCSSAEHIRAFSQDMFIDDIKRTEVIAGSYYNFHPGSHTGQGAEQGINQIAAALNSALTESQTTTVLLETMAGKGSEIGGRFEELHEIINKTELKDKIGVCLDTCHIYDGGYDIVNNLGGVIDEFNEIIGIEKLKVIHLNDSKNTLGSKKDRHAQIGKGNIGINAVSKIINHPVLKNLLFILETPQESLDGYAYEIELLKRLSG